jgi:hypothetical protein
VLLLKRRGRIATSYGHSGDECGEAERDHGRTYDNHQAYLYRFTDGLLSEGETIPVDQRAFDAFTSD